MCDTQLPERRGSLHIFWLCWQILNLPAATWRDPQQRDSRPKRCSLSNRVRAGTREGHQLMSEQYTLEITTHYFPGPKKDWLIPLRIVQQQHQKSICRTVAALEGNKTKTKKQWFNVMPAFFREFCASVFLLSPEASWSWATALVGNSNLTYRNSAGSDTWKLWDVSRTSGCCHRSGRGNAVSVWPQVSDVILLMWMFEQTVLECLWECVRCVFPWSCTHVLAMVSTGCHTQLPQDKESWQGRDNDELSEAEQHV